MSASRIRGVVAIALCALLAACGKPVPRDKAAYVGEWQQPTMYLLITQDGSVRYKRLRGGASTSITGPLQGFEGDNFDVGLGPVRSTFVVTRPPRESNGRWTMVVDGVELTRSTDPQPGARGPAAPQGPKSDTPES